MLTATAPALPAEVLVLAYVTSNKTADFKTLSEVAEALKDGARKHASLYCED